MPSSYTTSFEKQQTHLFEINDHDGHDTVEPVFWSFTSQHWCLDGMIAYASSEHCGLFAYIRFCVMSCFPEESWHFLRMCCTHHPNNNSSGKSGVYLRRKARCYAIQYLFSIICFLSLIVPSLKIWRSISLSSSSHTLHLVLCDRRRMGHFFPVECLAQEHQGDRL